MGALHWAQLAAAPNHIRCAQSRPARALAGEGGTASPATAPPSVPAPSARRTWPLSASRITFLGVIPNAFFRPQSHSPFESLYFFEMVSLFQHRVSPGSQDWLQLHEMNSNVDSVKYMRVCRMTGHSQWMYSTGAIEIWGVSCFTEEKRKDLFPLEKINILHIFVRMSQPLPRKYSAVELLRIVLIFALWVSPEVASFP